MFSRVLKSFDMRCERCDTCCTATDEAKKPDFWLGILRASCPRVKSGPPGLAKACSAMGVCTSFRQQAWTCRLVKLTQEHNFLDPQLTSHECQSEETRAITHFTYAVRTRRKLRKSCFSKSLPCLIFFLLSLFSFVF